MSSFYIPNRLSEMRHVGSCQLRALGDQVASMCLHPMARGKRCTERWREKLPVVAAEEFSQHVCVLNHVRLCDSMDRCPWGSSVRGSARQERWHGLPFPPSGDLPNPGIEPTSLVSPALAGGFSTTVPPKPQRTQRRRQKISVLYVKG